MAISIVPEAATEQVNSSMVAPTVFLWIYPTVHSEGLDDETAFHSISVWAELNVAVFRNRKDAEAFRNRSGGMVIETTADKLRGRIHGMKYDDTPEIGIYLQEMDSLERESNDAIDSKLPLTSLICDSTLPHQVIRCTGEGNECGDPDCNCDGKYGYVAYKFAPDADKWIRDFEAASGTVGHL